MKSDVFQLALEALNARKAEIEKQIAEIQAEIKGTSSKNVLNSKQSQSERMKAYWAARRAAKLKSGKAPAAAKFTRRRKTAAEKNAQSEKMKAIWAKRLAKIKAAK
jgi:hypothetical protein